MNITIHLKDPELCDGCPLLCLDDEEGPWCHFYLEFRPVTVINTMGEGGILRPEQCTKDNGE